jgi:iron complex transport system substrate-binding protein
MIALAGGANPWAKRDCKSTPITDEDVIAAAPDAIVLSWCGVKPEKVRPDVVQKRAAWRHVPAVAKERIYCVPEAWMGRPGPRLLEGLRAIRAIVTQVTS